MRATMQLFARNHAWRILRSHQPSRRQEASGEGPLRLTPRPKRLVAAGQTLGPRVRSCALRRTRAALIFEAIPAAASRIQGKGIFAEPIFACGLSEGPRAIGGGTSSRSRICRSSSLLSIASVSTLPCSSRWRGKAAFLLRRFRVAGRTCIPRQRLGLVLFTVH